MNKTYEPTAKALSEVYNAVISGLPQLIAEDNKNNDFFIISNTTDSNISINIIIGSPFITRKEIEDVVVPLRESSYEIELTRYTSNEYLTFDTLKKLLKDDGKYDNDAIIQVAEYLALAPFCPFSRSMEKHCTPYLHYGESYNRDFIRILMGDEETAMLIIRSAFNDIITPKKDYSSWAATARKIQDYLKKHRVRT
ncbi:MAG: hypothetical protein K6A90_13635 [Lachnospiraceae bacterium]|nr:hypothetical protein [Lachnospiraceae bacterium]